MKKKLRNGLLWAIAGLIAVVLLWPHSFTPLFENMEEMGAIIITSDIENGKPMSDTYSYHFTGEDAELQQIREIMGRYTYRYCLASLFTGGNISGNRAGYWLQLYPVDDAGSMMSIQCAGTGKVSVANVYDEDSGACTYQVGWFGDQASLELMGEIRAVLENSDNLVDSAE